MTAAWLMAATELSTAAKVSGGIAVLGSSAAIAGAIEGEAGCLPVGGVLILNRHSWIRDSGIADAVEYVRTLLTYGYLAPLTRTVG